MKNRGFIRLILSIIIIIVILSLFNIDIRSIFESELVQKNLGFVWGLLTTLWENILRDPALWIWNNVIIKLIVIPLENAGTIIS